jgi:outer membrane protein
MKTSSITIGLLLVLFSVMPLSSHAGEYSLGDLYKLAMERSEKVQIASENVTYYKLDKNRAISMLMPKLSAYGTYQQFTDDKYNDLNVLIQPKKSDNWGIRADQTMSLSLREFTAVSEAGNYVKKADYDLSATREAYLLQVAQSYYRMLMARKDLDIAGSNLERVTKYRNAAASRQKQGEVTKTVLLRAESELSGSRSDLVRAQNLLALAQASLARVVGIEGDFTLREEPYREAGTATLADLKTLAYKERPDLKSASELVTIAGQEVTWARGAYWPNLSMAGVYQNNAQDPETLTFNDQSTYGSLSLQFPFFEGGLRVAEVQQAKTRERQAKLQYEDLKKTVGMDVESAYLDVTTRRGQLKFLEDQAAFARDNYRGVSRQFNLGLASSLDVIDANNLLVSSERQLAAAMYSYQLSILSLEEATGTFMKEVDGKSNR